jgi:hypothetical protein
MDNEKYDPRIARFMWELHSMREGLLALNERIKCLDDDWACEKAHSMVETVWRASKTDKSLWNFEVFARPKRLAPFSGADERLRPGLPQGALSKPCACTTSPATTTWPCNSRKGLRA